VLAREAKGSRAGTDDRTKDDLLAFVRRSAVDGYATAERMAEVVRTGTRQLYVARADGTGVDPITRVEAGWGAIHACWRPKP